MTRDREEFRERGPFPRRSLTDNHCDSHMRCIMAKKNESANINHSESTSKGNASGSSDGSMSVVTTSANTATSSPVRPLRTFRLKGVKASVFENRTEQGAFYKTSLQKVYRDGEEWKTTTSLSRDDLPVARLLLSRAWEFILETEASARHSEQGE